MKQSQTAGLMNMNERERVTIAIDKQLHRQLYEAKPYGNTMQEFTETLLMEALNDHDR